MPDQENHADRTELSRRSTLAATGAGLVAGLTGLSGSAATPARAQHDEESSGLSADADFQIVDVDPSDDIEVEEGEEAAIDVTVENQGSEQGTQDIEFVIGGNVLDDATEELTLDAGEEDTVTRSTTTPSVEDDVTLDWYIQTDDDQSATWTLTITESGEADFQIVDVDPGEDLEVEGDAEFAVDVTVENQGDDGGTQAVEFVRDGDVDADEELTLDVGEEDTATLELTAPSVATESSWFVQTDDDQSVTWLLTVDGDEPSVGDYTDDDGNAEPSDVFDAIGDWRDGRIETDIIFGVIDAWRNS